MNRNINLFGKTIPVWFLTIAIVGAGSLAIATQGGAVHMEDAPDIQHSSDVKVHLQDVDGKVITNVPISASRTFSPLPVEFSDDVGTDTSADMPGTASTTGSVMITKQKLAFNFVLDTAEDTEYTLKLDNNSEDTQIFLIKANAPPHVIIDFESGTNATPSNNVTVHGLTGHNEWLASVPTSTNKELKMEVSVTDAGFYPIVVELLRIG
jgi:hypothetical protein